MDAKLFNGTTKYQKILLSPKITYLDYIKLHGVHGNPSCTVAGSFASRPKEHLLATAIFMDVFSLPLIQEKQAVSFWRNKMVAK